MGLFKPNVEKLESKKDIKGLTKVLNDKDEYVQEQAIWALVKYEMQPLSFLLSRQNLGL